MTNSVCCSQTHNHQRSIFMITLTPTFAVFRHG
jgi:hypothetical protein